MPTLRDYQQNAVDMTWAWMREHPGNPCVVLATGSGKSICIADMCKQIVQNWCGRVLVMSHVKELVAQDAGKIREHWPNAPMGVYSAGLKRRELGEPITVASIQSIAHRVDQLGPVDVSIVDEAHLINHKEQGRYREVIAALTERNPAHRVIGYTATPYRMGHGLITDDPAIFDALIEPTSIEELIYRGFLSPLRSKLTKLHYDLSSVHKRGGEYIEGELAKAVDTSDQNEAVVREVIERAGERRHWLFFCTGVEHAYHVRDVLRAHGVSAETVTGDTPTNERDSIIQRYKAGEFKALTNAEVLTTGFDFPDIDLIAMLRPTMSVNIYVQVAGRGMRLKSHTDHCLFLDFAGVIQQHGPITSPITPEKAGEGNGEAPVKTCPQCDELVGTSTRVCPTCGHEWEFEKAAPKGLHDDDIMGEAPTEVEVERWKWFVHTSKKSGKAMLRVDYIPVDFSQQTIREYLCVEHGGFAERKAWVELANIARDGGFEVPQRAELQTMADQLNVFVGPSRIEYKKENDFPRIVRRVWERQTEQDDDDIPF